jgi:hypothetical protein
MTIPIVKTAMESDEAGVIETKRKISEALKGRSSWLKGKHHSQETRAKISASNMGRDSLPRAGALNGMYGKQHSTQTKLKISAAMTRFWKHSQRKKL